MLPEGSPFAAFPNTEANSSASPMPMYFRGRVTFVYKTSDGQPLFKFKVTPLSGSISTGAADNELDPVILAHPGFGNLDQITPPPSGIVYVPEVGSHVLVMWDGHQWCIIGYYSGPVETNLETGADPESRVVSYNPGIETDTSRRQGLPGWDLPHWSFGISEGDILLGKGQARVKVNNQGVVVGADLDAFRIYTSDGSVIERFGRYEKRGVGNWKVHKYRRCDPSALRAKTQIPDQAITPPDAACYNAEIVEVSPTPDAERPYLLEQKGYVSRSLVNDGRSSMVTDVSALTAITELEAKDYVVHREAVIQPLRPDDPKIPGGELDDSAYELFDRQVDANGSWRIRAGNKNQLPGAQTPANTNQMDLSIDYDSVGSELTIRIGLAGQKATEIVLKGNDPSSAILEVVTSRLVADVRDSVEVTAKKAVVRANDIQLDGNVRITGNLTVDQGATIATDAEIAGIPFTKHRHGHGDPAGVTNIPQI